MRGRTFYVGTTVDALGLVKPPERGSALFAFDARTGELNYRIDVAGENRAKLHGLAGMAVDRDGGLYVSDVQQGILRFDLASRSYTVYGWLRDLPSCLAVLSATSCSPTTDDREPLGNGRARGR